MLSYSLSGGLEGLGTGGALSLQQAGGKTHWLSEIPVSYTSYNSTCQLKTVPVGFQQACFASLLLFECVVKRATELCLLLLPRGGQELPPPRSWWHQGRGTAPLVGLGFQLCLVQQ